VAPAGRRIGELVRIAIQFAVCFGALEAIETAFLRGVPSVQSMNKVSLDILWVAPAFHVITNVVLAVLIWLALRGRRVGPIPEGLFAFTGALGITLYSGYLGRVAAVLLAIGAAVQIARVSQQRASWRPLYRWVAAVAILVVASPFVIRGYEQWQLSRAHAAAVPPNLARPNVMLLVLDTVRADHLSSYGYPRPITPHLDRLAQEGVLFTDAYSASSWTLPSHASLLTGLPVTKHGALSAWEKLESNQLQLQESLASQGYATAAFVSNKVFVLPEWGFGEGFDVFDVYDVPTLFARTTLGRSTKTLIRRLDWVMDPFRTATVLDGHFQKWVSGIGQRPFFVLFNFMEAHEPYGLLGDRPALTLWDHRAQRTPADNAVLAKAYARGIEDLDAQLGKLFEESAKQPWWNQTLVIVVADHGEIISDGSFEHGLDLTREELHVPLIMRFPGKVPAGLRIETPVTTNDVAATIDELVGPPTLDMAGHSLSRFFASGSDTPPAAQDGVLSELVHPRDRTLRQSIILDDYHYIVNVGTGAERLYQIRNDPNEKQNLAADPENALALKKLRDALQRHRNSEALDR
jgi:arylsulfatase A-like enzyme